MSNTEDPVVTNRRHRLKLWIDTNYGGSQKLFIASTNDGEKQINQGELSGLMRRKSFGEKRARSLERQARMPQGYLDEQANLADQVQPPPIDASSTSISSWPFKNISADRLATLKRNLGPQKYSDAISDMEELLESTMIKWERRVDINLDKSDAA